MDLSDPDVLRSTLARLFRQEASKVALGAVGIPDDALDPMVAPPPGWRGDLTNVDEGRLREALREVAEQLIASRGLSAITGADAVAAAMKASGCHYLWFC